MRPLQRPPKNHSASLLRGRTLFQAYRRFLMSLRRMFARFAWKALKIHTIQKKEEINEFHVVMYTTQTVSLYGSIAAALALFVAAISPFSTHIFNCTFISSIAAAIALFVAAISLLSAPSLQLLSSL